MVILPSANVCATLGVPVTLIVLPLRTAVKPVGKPLTLAIVNGTAPPPIVIVLLKPEMPAVHCVVVRLPTDGGTAIVIVNVLVTVAPRASWRVMLPAKIVAAVGVPVMRIVSSDRTAVRPAGRALEAMLSAPVPPATVMALT